MKLSRIFYSLIIISALFFQSCDKIDAPYKETGGGGDDTTEVRTVLLEDFTAQQCPNCPTASKVAQDLKDLYGNKLIILAVHAGILAEPDSEYPIDYRTPAGNKLYIDYGFPFVGLPNGLINRMKKNSTSHIFGHGEWGSVIDTLVTKPQDARIKITNTYNASTRNVDIQIDAEFLNALTGSFNICVYILEDSIISKQINNNSNVGPIPVIDDYIHRHVLRGAVNGTYGDALTSGTVNIGTPYTKNYSYTLDAAWDETHCSVLALVTETTTKEVIQAAEKHIE